MTLLVAAALSFSSAVPGCSRTEVEPAAGAVAPLMSTAVPVPSASAAPARAAVGMVKLPRPIRSEARPLTSTDLFAPTEIDRLKYDIRVEGTFPLLRQDKPRACWATAAAMLAGWKQGRTMTPSDYLATITGPYLAIYEGDLGLRRDDKAGFLQRTGLNFEWGASYHPDGVAKMLKKHGPLWFTVNQADKFSMHATVIVGLVGTGEMPSTYVIYADPADGKEHASPYAEFMTAYENVAFDLQGLGNLDESFQVAHFP